MSDKPIQTGHLQFAALKRRHQAELERQRVALSVPFQKRAEVLMKRIQKELPNVGYLVYCNGDSWLVPVGFPHEKSGSEQIPYLDHNGAAKDEEGGAVTDSMRAALFDAWAAQGQPQDRPNVSARCLADMIELHDLCGYCEDENLDVPSTI